MGSEWKMSRATASWCMSRSASSPGCKVGDILGFTVSANDKDKGAFASRVEPITQDKAA